MIDHSGSMNGKKIEQVKEAARQILSGLQEGEAFNLIIYNENVDSLSSTPLLSTPANIRKAREYIDRIQATVARLLEAGVAYQAGGSVYYRASAAPDLGALAGDGADLLAIAAADRAQMADAVIVADMGVADYAARRHPDLRLHLSVQAGASSPEAIRQMPKAPASFMEAAAMSR